MKKAYADYDYIINKAALGLDFSSLSDPEEVLNSYCEVCSRLIDNYTQNIFYAETITGEKNSAIVDHKGRIVYRTFFKPINTVTKFEVVALPTERVEIALTSLDIHSNKGIVYAYAGNGFKFEGYNVQIDYTAGPTTVPSPIQRACALLLRNMLRPGDLSSGVSESSSSNKGTLTKIKSMSYEEHYAQVGGATSGMEMRVKDEDNFLFTSDIKAILIPYTKRGIL